MKFNLPSIHHMFKIHIFLLGGSEDAMEILAILVHKFYIYPCLDHLNSQVVFMLTNVLASTSCTKKEL